MAKKSLMAGALILTMANLTTRFIGFFYRIYMSNTIGAEGIGLYQLIMPLYMLAWSITSSGFTTTISKLTAQENAKRQHGNIGLILKQCLFLCCIVSVLLSFLMYTFSDFAANYILKDPRTMLPLKVLSVCFPFMSAGSCIRGYFFGMQDSAVPAMSQVLEQCTRIVTVFLTISLLAPKGLAYACTSAVLGIVLGEILSFLFVFLCYIYYKRKNHYTKKPSLSRQKSFLLVTSMALPLTANRVTGSLLSTVENILIPQRLQLFGKSGTDAMGIYGSLTGMAMPIIQFPSALLTAVSITLVPAISEASAVRNQMRIHDTINRTLLFTTVIGIGTSSIFAVFPNEISLALYNKADIGTLLFQLSPICIFLYLQITLTGLLNGLGEQVFIFRNNMISSFINILFIYFFIPLYGASAFILGWFVSLCVTAVLSLHKLSIKTGFSFDVQNMALKPLLAIFASGLTTKYIVRCLNPNRITYILCVVLMLLFYIVCLLAIGCIKKEDLPKLFHKS